MKSGSAAKVVSTLFAGALLFVACVASLPAQAGAQSYDPSYQQYPQSHSSYGGYNYDPYGSSYGGYNNYWYDPCQYNYYDPYSYQYGQYGYGNCGGYNNWYGGGYNNYYCYYYPWYPGCGGGGGGGYGYGGAPSITSVNGPTSLRVGEQGTWRITTNAPSNTYLSVSVRWGDENMYAYPTSAYGQQVYQQNTFTHTYRQAGTYTVTFTATDNYGRSNIATATVNVMNTNINPQCWYDYYSGRWVCY